MVLLMSPMTLEPAFAAKSTFYLNLKANTCYSFTTTGTKPSPISNPSKSLYAVACSKPHHFQVIKVGQVPSAGSSLTQDDMSEYCRAAYRKLYNEEAPQTISDGAIYLRWFFPDPGAETKKYKKTGICLVHQSNSVYSVYSVLKSKI
jgi:hypothetical protein